MSAQTSILGVELASDKEGTKRILLMLGTSAKRYIINYLDELEEAMKQSAAILS